MVIECTVASKFEPKCTWFKESNEVKQSSRHVYVVEKTKEGEFAVKLEINEVEDTDKGAYKLVASNEKGEAVSQIVNLVDIPEEERKPTKPEITRKLTDQKVTEGKTFELLISLKQADRKCKIEWYKGSSIVTETKDITTTFDGTTARLTLSSARMEHSSTYKVVVSNEAGKDESTCKIVVEKKQDKKKKEEEEAAEVKRKVINKKVEDQEEKKKDENIIIKNEQETVEINSVVEVQESKVKHKTEQVVQISKLEAKVEEHKRRVSFSTQKETVIEETSEMRMQEGQEVQKVQLKDSKQTKKMSMKKQSMENEQNVSIKVEQKQESTTVSQVIKIKKKSQSLYPRIIHNIIH